MNRPFLLSAIAAGSLAAVVVVSAVPDATAPTAARPVVAEAAVGPTDLLATWDLADTAVAAHQAQQAAARKAAAAAAAAAAERRQARLAKLAEERRERAAKRRASRDRSYASGSGAPVSSGSARAIAKSQLAARGWSDQFGCLDRLWQKESGWRWNAASPSGAYGIPQALPGSKMASAGADWRTNPATQIRWGLGYIDARHGDPCGAWSHFQSRGWY